MNKLLFVILYRLHIKLQPYYHKKYQSSLTPCYPNTVIFSHTYKEQHLLNQLYIKIMNGTT